MPLSAIIFIICFLLGCVLAAVRHPVYGLMTYIVTLYLDPAGQWWGQNLLPQVRWEFIPAVITVIALLFHRRRMPSPVFRSGAFRGFVMFVVWLLIQLPSAINPHAQTHLLTVWSKFLLVAVMICGCVDSWKNLRMVLWSHVFGCAYMGWTAYIFYRGGRFQGFGLNSIGDANTAALELVIGFLVAAALFLSERWPAKVILLLAMGFIADGILMTVSRSGFLELTLGGLAFLIFTPKAYRSHVKVAATLAVICFISLSGAYYWHRIHTIKDTGAKVSGVDTGHGRLVIIGAQWRMFHVHPLAGCGYGCTETLSPYYIPKQYLAQGLGKRASHNTVMTMLVSFGIPGAIFYLSLLAWLYKSLKRLAPHVRFRDGLPATFFPALVGVVVAVTVGDQFSQFPMLEVRIWYVSLLIAYTQLLMRDVKSTSSAVVADQPDPQSVEPESAAVRQASACARRLPAPGIPALRVVPQ